MKTQTINIPGFGEVSLISLSKVIASLPETAPTGRLALAINQDGDLSLIPVGGGGSVSVKNSLEFDNGSIQLVGDAETPGSLRYYGTDSNGEKGFFALPALSDVVTLTGNQTIAGVKTFSLSPIVPDPTTDGEAANKKYVDDNAGDSFVPDPEGAPDGQVVQTQGGEYILGAGGGGSLSPIEQSQLNAKNRWLVAAEYFDDEKIGSGLSGTQLNTGQTWVESTRSTASADGNPIVDGSNSCSDGSALFPFSLASNFRIEAELSPPTSTARESGIVVARVGATDEERDRITCLINSDARLRIRFISNTEDNFDFVQSFEQTITGGSYQKIVINVYSGFIFVNLNGQTIGTPIDPKYNYILGHNIGWTSGMSSGRLRKLEVFSI